MMKKILCLILLTTYSLCAFCQDKETDSNIVGKGSWMISVNFGIGSYISNDAPIPNLPDYSISAPMTSWFDKNPILGIEAKWFVTDKWALKLGGGFSFSHNPGYSAVLGTGSEQGDIPTYNAVASSDKLQFAIEAGAAHYFPVNDKLYFHAGGEFVYAYGRVTSMADSEEYMGKSIGEAYSFKVAPVVGFDYFLNSSLFIGADVRPLSYQYSVYDLRPQEGLKLLSSDNSTFSFISQPMIKLGVKF